jgi:predicted nucleotidyltransferase
MNNFNTNWKEYLLEDDFDKSKLMIKDKLNDKIWENGQLKEEVALKLMEIAQDFYESLQEEIENLPDFEDVTFTGSLASYNYHNLSDIDLHLRVDFEKITESRELIEKLFTEKRIRWNNTHKIIIFGHEVEIYIEDTNEEHFANGIYSVLRREWIEMPTKQQVDIDFDATKKKYSMISKEVDQLSAMFDDEKYKEVFDYTNVLKDKIKRMRQSGLEDEGIFSSENLAFKMLRINGELETLSGLKISAYDKMKSLDKKGSTKVNISEIWKQFKESHA